MKYIYFIWRSNKKNTIDFNDGAGNYIGQGDDEGYARMLEHLEIAYGHRLGTVYGSEQLIRDVGASNVIFGAYTDANFGISTQVWQAFQESGWEITSPEAKLDAAEILHIVSHHGDLSAGNIMIGGRTPDLIFNLEKMPWYRDLTSKYKVQAHDTKDNSLKHVTIHFPDRLEDSQFGPGAMSKLFHPEYYGLLRLTSLIIEQNIFTVSKLLELMRNHPSILKGKNPEPIRKEVKKEINKIQQIVSQTSHITLQPTDKDNLVNEAVNKFMVWVGERLGLVSVQTWLKQEGLTEGQIRQVITGVTINGRQPKDPNSMIYGIKMSRNTYLNFSLSYQPKWYKVLMENIPSVPSNNTTKTDSEIFRYVGNKIYSIFTAKLQKEIVRSGEKPNDSLYAKVRAAYKSYRPLDYFELFYRAAISKWQNELRDSPILMEVSEGTEATKDNKTRTYIFKPLLYETPWVYRFLPQTASKINVLLENSKQSNYIIPSYLW